MCIPPETKDPVLLHLPTRKSMGYFGAVRLRAGKFVLQREQGKFNGDSFFGFLKNLRKVSCHAGRRVIVILDNATFHHARVHRHWRSQAKSRFALEFLPPYSPDLSPIERVWKLTRRKATHNRYFPTLNQLIDNIEEVFTLRRN